MTLRYRLEKIGFLIMLIHNYMILQKWLVSPYVGDQKANIGISSIQSCAEDHSSENFDTDWYFYNGDSSEYLADCSLNVVCKSSRRRRFSIYQKVPGNSR